MVTISPEDPGQPEVVALLEAGDAFVAALYPAESNHMLDVDALRRAGVTFLVARSGGRALGCAALVKSGEDWCEIKRMFVSPKARGLGIGRRLLVELEALARGAAIRLETGVRQPEALALYESAGFHRVEAFGDYKPDPLSVFMEKRLGD